MKHTGAAVLQYTAECTRDFTGSAYQAGSVSLRGFFLLYVARGHALTSGRRCAEERGRPILSSGDNER